MDVSDFDQVVEESYSVWDEFVKGNPEPSKQMFSHRDEITLASPFGGIVRGWEEVDERLDHAASHYTDGEVTGFENMAKHVSGDLACMVELERFEVKVGGREEIVPVSLRVTSIFGVKTESRKLVHRHADPNQCSVS